MREHGVEPDLVPESARAEGLVTAFEKLGVGKGARVLIPRALKAREVLPYALRLRGVEVDVAPVYQTIPIAADPDVLERLRAGSVDCVTFTSGAIARAFVAVLVVAGLDPDAIMERVAVASIGPVTTHDLAVIGYENDIEAPRATMGALAQAIADYFVARS
jgi:uroporphyrinogen III methyltransferase/synthase